MPKNIKCKNCNNLHRASHWCEKVIDSPDEEVLRDCRHFWERTNGDKIRAMTDEELGKFLMRAHDGALEIPFCKYMDECFDDVDAITNAKCMICMMEWLQQPAEVDV